MDETTDDSVPGKTSGGDSPRGEIAEKAPDLLQEALAGKSKQELWDAIGFHRPLAGFYFNLVFLLLTLIAGIFLTGGLLALMYPFPESVGYRTIATGLFTLFFTTFDLGTNMIMSRYIGESMVKNPRRAVKYVQYFIWYQMITGLIQTTAVSLYALFVVPRTELTYAIWIMLIHSTTQYPGFLGVFRNTLDALQQFNKKKVLDFLGGEIFERLTEIGFIFLGRYLGAQDPAVGELMGIAIGATVGLYVDNFIVTLISARLFARAMADYDVTVRDCFRVEFDWPLAKECLVFGIKSGMPTVIGTATGLAILYIKLGTIPQLATYIALMDVAKAIGNVIDQQVTMTAAISESFLNDKKALARYQIGQAWRFAGQIQFLILPIQLILLPVIGDVFPFLGLDNYLLAIPFIVPQIIRSQQQPYTTLADHVVTGSDHPTFLMIIRFLEELGKLLGAVVFFVWIDVAGIGGAALIWGLVLFEYPAILFKTTSMWVFVQRKIVRLQVPWWQAFGAPACAAGCTLLTFYAYYHWVFAAMLPVVGILGAAIPFLFVLIAGGIFLYFPLTAVFGGWDAGSLATFQAVVKMTGPSRFLVEPVSKLVAWAAARSPLHDRFPHDDTAAVAEARELMRVRARKRAEMQQDAK